MGEMREEIRRLVAAPKDSELGKARRTVGWSLIVFGLIGVPILIAVLLVVGYAISSAF